MIYIVMSYTLMQYMAINQIQKSINTSTYRTNTIIANIHSTLNNKWDTTLFDISTNSLINNLSNDYYTQVVINRKVDTKLDITAYHTSTATLGNVTCKAIFCKYDVKCGDLQANTIYGNAISQVQKSMNASAHAINTSIRNMNAKLNNKLDTDVFNIYLLIVWFII